MIQTWEQYQFVHQVLSRYARVLAGENVHTPSTSSSLHNQPDFYSHHRHSPDQVSRETKAVTPLQPKQRRSFSITDLPAAKDLKDNEVVTDDVFGVMSPRPTTTNKPGRSRSSLKRSSPPTPPSPLPGCHVDAEKGPNSPAAVRSRFTRLCLQPMSLNLKPETPPPGDQSTKSCRFSFDSKLSGAGESPVAEDVKENSPHPTTTTTNAFEFPNLTNGYSSESSDTPSDHQVVESPSSFKTFVYPLTEGDR